MISKFESLFTTKDLVRSKYPDGWVGWLNDKMSYDDDGSLTRFTTMDGRHMHRVVEKLISYGFKSPILNNSLLSKIKVVKYSDLFLYLIVLFKNLNTLASNTSTLVPSGNSLHEL